MTVVREDEIVMPISLQILLGWYAVEPEIVEIFEPQPRWDEPVIDEVLEARCSSL
jgi:hypothetical protein